MKREKIITSLTCLVLLIIFVGCYRIINPSVAKSSLKIGFVYDNDESTPYTYNFSLAKDAVEKKYGEQVTILTCSNVLDDEMEEPLRELADEGCDIIFFNGYSELVKELAPEYPKIQFCQTSYMDMNGVSVPDNYHTFKGEAYQGRYVSGIAAGKKIAQMISDGVITEDNALVGFVAAFPTSEVISGYTAFILGVRSVVSTARMEVSYTNTWSSYAHEKSAAKKLIEDGCVVISQHTDTIGPAIACEEASETGQVYFVGYNQSMSEVAPGTSLVTSRICWEPYILSAVEAGMADKKIETVVQGRIHGNDVSAGFEKGWVEMVDLNQQIAAPGTQEAMDSAINRFKRGNGDFVFEGDYIGVNPDNPSDTWDLNKPYIENENTSYPLFNYILSDIISIVE
ncbi:BMP family ABC transporter substrate-binding protein [Butyrivibrio sp. AE2032]|uniref:BMP family ABC transporter substrate-binding protein n=1 Tax=Butyrivibrio sp. AE2032 TaxID=1458463 RepID=UPI00068FC8C4|nr:BMP family ABC transporter substrate-binding protein [Butyrivibrio sp. AE2032]